LPAWPIKEKLILPRVGKRLLRDLVFAIRASCRFGQDELEGAVLPDDFGQKPVERNLGIAGTTVLTTSSKGCLVRLRSVLVTPGGAV
jgi:hypothetical protein